MEELESAREKFLKSIRELNGYNENYEFAENERITADNYKKRQVQYRKPELKRPKAKKTIRRFTGKQKIAALIATGIIALGGNIFIHHLNEQNKPITYAQAITQMGESPETLGITTEDVIKIEQIKDVIEDKNITDKDAKSVLPRIHSVIINVLESKFSKVLNTEKDNLSFNSEYIDYKSEGLKTIETLKVFEGSGKKEYSTTGSWLDTKNSFNLPSEVSSSIKAGKAVENTMKEIQEGKFDKKKVLKVEKESIDDLSRFAAMKLEKDEKNNIIAKVIRKKDLDEYKKQKEKNSENKSNIYKTSSEAYNTSISTEQTEKANDGDSR